MRVQEDERRRHHVGGQSSCSSNSPQRGTEAPRRSWARHRPPGACPRARPRAPQPPPGAPRDALEDGLDLAQLDAKAAHLDLVVDAPQKVDVAIRQIARQVAAPVQPRPRLGTNGSGTNLAAVSSGRLRYPRPNRRRRGTARPAPRSAPAACGRRAGIPACCRLGRPMVTGPSGRRSVQVE